VTIALASSAGNTGSGSSLVLSGITATTSDTIALGAFGVMNGNNPVTISGVSDSAGGNTWNLPSGGASGYYYSAETSYVGLAIAWCTPANALSSGTVTITFSASTVFSEAGAGVFSGVPSGSVTALSASATYGASDTSLTGPPVSPPAANYLVFTAVGINGYFSAVAGSWALLPEDFCAWVATSAAGAESAALTVASSASPVWNAATIAIGPAISSAVNSGAFLL
jgi:hypothetical protein